ncbi:hypothetical protein BIY40_02530 [Pediococcus acidilactici]|nr:hypothetical protein BIY40_02530 [Pediococcus acidilactici]
MFDNGYLPQNSKDWVGKIREFGNKATHRLVVNTKKDAQLMIKFCEMILKINYELMLLSRTNNNSSYVVSTIKLATKLSVGTGALWRNR